MKSTTNIHITVFFLFAIFPLNLYAHPHNWITLKSEFLLDDEGRLTEIRQQWNFDAFYSMMTLADVMNEYRDEQKGLKKLAKDMVKNLAGHNYFSKLNVNSHNIPLPTPRYHKLDAMLVDGQQQLVFYMNFKLPEPQPIEGKTVAWRVFDPTYYIDMRHGAPNQIVIHTQNATECSKSIDLPEPSDEIIDYASGLDKSKKDTEGLGAYFAEKIQIQCI